MKDTTPTISNRKIAELEKILKLTRNPEAPDVHTLEIVKNEYNFVRRVCPECGSQERVDSFYGHYTREHAPDWKLNMVLSWVSDFAEHITPEKVSEETKDYSDSHQFAGAIAHNCVVEEITKRTKEALK